MYQYQYYTHDQQSEQYGPPCSLCGGCNHSPKHCYKGEHRKFIETMPTMIQTHLITCKDWATVKHTVKSLKHIIMKCNPPTPAMPMMATGATVLGLYSHIAHSVDKDEGEIPQPFKGTKPKQTRGRGKPKGKPQEQRQNPPNAQEADETYTYENPNNYYHNAPSQC